jgi:hypothetical protein
LIGATWRMGLGCVAMLAGLVGISGVLPVGPAWLICTINIVVGGAIYGLVTLLLRSEEPMAVMRRVRNRIRSSSRRIRDK